SSLLLWPPPRSTLFPYTTLFRSGRRRGSHGHPAGGEPRFSACAWRSRRVLLRGLVHRRAVAGQLRLHHPGRYGVDPVREVGRGRSEEHTSELQSRENLVCRLLLE